MIVIAFPQLEGVHGIARYIRSFIATYPADAPPLHVIAGDHGPDLDFPSNVTVEYIPVPDSRAGLFKWGWAARKRLIALSRDSSIAAINVHIPPMIPVLMIPKVAPIIVTAHTTYLGMSGDFYAERLYESDWKGLSLKVKKWMEGVIFKGASGMVTLTEQGRQELARYGNNGPVDIIPNGVDVSRFEPDEKVAKSIDVIFAGRIEKRKGSRPMVEVVKRMVAARPGIRIAIVGYGDDDEYVRAKLSGLAPTVLLTGKVPFSEVAPLFDSSRVYVSTSYYEGLPGTCIEAMAMNLPAIVWDFPFYDGLVESDVTGYRVKPNDYDAFAAAALDLLDRGDDAVAMGKAGRKMVLKAYNWQTLGPRIVSALTSVGAKDRAA
jgi:glycosyltransferase involved in cell wall biosynthesis